jgi:hypothetical protein
MSVSLAIGSGGYGYRVRMADRAQASRERAQRRVTRERAADCLTRRRWGGIVDMRGGAEHGLIRPPGLLLDAVKRAIATREA